MPTLEYTCQNDLKDLGIVNHTLQKSNKDLRLRVKNLEIALAEASELNQSKSKEITELKRLLKQAVNIIEALRELLNQKYDNLFSKKGDL